MNNKTQGAWLVHHSQKLRNVSGAQQDYEQIDFAGKCGSLLNAIASSNQSEISNERIKALAKGAGLSTRTDLPPILDELEKHRLIDTGENAVEVS